MRTTVHSSIKKTPFERHYGRKPRLEIHKYLNVSPNKITMFQRDQGRYMFIPLPMEREHTINL